MTKIPSAPAAATASQVTAPVSLVAAGVADCATTGSEVRSVISRMSEWCGETTNRRPVSALTRSIVSANARPSRPTVAAVDLKLIKK
ncbi:hypothetical protein [Natrialba swarupiae]|uniref:hypothetical protein n=1 Tax=Natrialba swarupiae TaxID=2448032 RepID=UPI003083EC61